MCFPLHITWSFWDSLSVNLDTFTIQILITFICTILGIAYIMIGGYTLKGRQPASKGAGKYSLSPPLNETLMIVDMF